MSSLGVADGGWTRGAHLKAWSTKSRPHGRLIPKRAAIALMRRAGSFISKLAGADGRSEDAVEEALVEDLKEHHPRPPSAAQAAPMLLARRNSFSKDKDKSFSPFPFTAGGRA